MNEVDIAVIGAGFVGTPLARVLAAQGWSVALLDAGNRSDASNRQPADALAQRCTALSLGTRQWFESQGLWAGIAEDACPIKQVHVSHKGYFGSTRLQAEDMNIEAVGYVVNNERLNAALLQDLDATSVQYVQDARVNRVSFQPSGVTIDYAGKQLHARLLIAADGVSSTVRECAGIDTQQTDYDQLAALTTVRLSAQHRGIAYERFTDSGPLAMLPRPGPYMSVVDCMETAQRETVSSMSDDQYLERLQQRFGHRLGQFEAVGPRVMIPLVKIQSTRQVGERVVLLGNAMRLLHPVGGQGYNLAMRDVAELQKLLKTQQSNDLVNDPGSAELLERFATSRLRDQKQVVRFTDVLARSFRGRASLPAHIRAFGLLSLDTLSPLRRQFAQRTMGIL